MDEGNYEVWGEFGSMCGVNVWSKSLKVMKSGLMKEGNNEVREEFGSMCGVHVWSKGRVRKSCREEGINEGNN